MNKALFYIVLFLFTLSNPAKAQTNLIYNGDFELYDTCPIIPSDITDLEILHCLGWSPASLGTPDYFNACSLGLVGVPYNFVGNQNAFTGNGYCGIIAASFDDFYWFEYLQSKLTIPLVKDRVYTISFRTSLAESQSSHAIRRLGVYLSPDSLNLGNALPINVIPSIEHPIYITDTLNWTIVRGEFKSEGNEKFIIIGYFSDTLALDTIATKTNFGEDDFYSYYYIDGVQVFDLNEDNPQNIFSPNGDGLNEVWSLGHLNENEFIEIYNRWGNKITTLNSNNLFWDGTTKSGYLCCEGIYYYTINSNERKQSGFIQLVR